MQTPFGFAQHLRQRLTVRLAVLLCLITASIFSILAAAIWKARAGAIAKARLEASYISAALDDDVEGVLNTLSCVSKFVKERIRTENTGTLLTDLYKDIRQDAPSLSAVSIIGPDGMLVAKSDGPSWDISNFSSFDFFRAQRSGYGRDFQIGKPLTISGRVIVPATRRFRNGEGVFDGLVLFAIDPALGAATYRKVSLGETGSIKIIGTDGTIFAGYSLPRGFDPAIIGTIFPHRVLMHWRLVPSGSFIAAGTDGTGERIYFWRKISGFPLIAVVGIGQAEALEGANREAALMIALGALTAGLLFWMAAVLNRELALRFRQALLLDSHRRKLREANAELAAAKKLADEANRSKSQFLAHISHELRTPLNAVLGFAEIIRDQIFGNDPPRYARYAADIYEAGAHVLNVIGSLLDLSKIEAGKLDLHETVERLDKIIGESLRVVMVQAGAQGVTLIEKNLQPALIVRVDKTALKQMLLNLLSNAVKFTRRGGLVTVSSSLGPDGRVMIEVSDTGIGMTAEEVRQALEPYRQLQPGLSAHTEGTGLGLPLTARLAELHGGALEIKSKPGCGTTATITLPPARVHTGGASKDVPACEPGSSP